MWESVEIMWQSKSKYDWGKKNMSSNKSQRKKEIHQQSCVIMGSVRFSHYNDRKITDSIGAVATIAAATAAEISSAAAVAAISAPVAAISAPAWLKMCYAEMFLLFSV